MNKISKQEIKEITVTRQSFGQREPQDKEPQSWTPSFNILILEK